MIATLRCWVPITLITSGDPQNASSFYARVKPPGPGWRAVAALHDQPAPEALWPHMVRWFVALSGILLCLLGAGTAFLSAPVPGVLSVFLGLLCLLYVTRNTREAA